MVSSVPPVTEAVPYIEPSPRRWEYKILSESFVEKLGEGELAAGLGQLSDDGWELVGFEKGRFVFKRQKWGCCPAEPGAAASALLGLRLFIGSLNGWASPTTLTQRRSSQNTCRP
jgi:hypothetical protein